MLFNYRRRHHVEPSKKICIFFLIANVAVMMNHENKILFLSEDVGETPNRENEMFFLITDVGVTLNHDNKTNHRRRRYVEPQK